MRADHVVGRELPTHRRWDVGVEPVVEVADGDVVTLHADDFAGGQIRPDSVDRDLLGLDFDAIYPLAGPVYVAGAAPGDAIAIEVLEVETADWGWACILPGLGLLPEAFTDPAIRHFDLTGETAELTAGVRIPIEPFMGTMGVPPAGARDLPIPPPHHGGGNIDTRHLVAGSTLILPVSEPGALFSTGDGHAAQGDGEVAISGIETACTVTVRLSVLPGKAPRSPRLRLPAGSLTPRADQGAWRATLGVEPDLMEASRAAVREMIDELSSERGLSPEDAYMLCSLAADLKICEVVDAPNWVVGCFLPDVVFVDG